ncbi:MAG: class I tRNA ligase family protein, partial [Polyangiales bacterium]
MSAHTPPADVAAVLKLVHRPRRMVVTAGMPYANGPLHLGHLAGAHLPADVFARFMRMVIGPENVLFVCGTDEHGSTSELAALQAGVPIRDAVDRVHVAQAATLERYAISLDVYSGTSQPECFPLQKRLVDDFLAGLDRNGLLEKRTSRQWYDPKAQRFLPDRFVRGRCPNPKCDNDNAYSDECDRCGHQYAPSELIDPRSAVSDAVPVMRDTVHLWLDMWSVSETLRTWIESKAKTWRAPVLAEVLDKVRPSL